MTQQVSTDPRPSWRFALAHLGIVAALGPAAWLAWPEDPPPTDPPADLDRHASVTGRLRDVDGRAFTLVRRGERPLRFTVRDGDRGRFDPVHLREHARTGVPTRVWFARERGGLRAVFQQDD